MKTRRRVTMLVTVSVPIGMNNYQARREVRALVNEQCNHSAGYGDVKLIGAKGAPRKPNWLGLRG